mmetsp:Transcript_92240/g.192897  ORF Transcript_92240/g.192897 Transcript_92240/m.192897 type:complete len:243 (+) Transcript_92240:562-1290(+)
MSSEGEVALAALGLAQLQPIAQQHRVGAVRFDLLHKLFHDLFHSLHHVLFLGLGLGTGLCYQAGQHTVPHVVLLAAGHEATDGAQLHTVLPGHPGGSAICTCALVEVILRVHDFERATLAVWVHGDAVGVGHFLAIRILRPPGHHFGTMLVGGGTQEPRTLVLAAIAGLRHEPLLVDAPVVVPVLVHQLAFVAEALAGPVLHRPISKAAIFHLVIRALAIEGTDVLVREEVLVRVVAVLAID